MHLSSRKKFCMSTTTRAVLLGSIEIETPAAPVVVWIVSLEEEGEERS